MDPWDWDTYHTFTINSYKFKPNVGKDTIQYHTWIVWVPQLKTKTHANPSELRSRGRVCQLSDELLGLNRIGGLGEILFLNLVFQRPWEDRCLECPNTSWEGLRRGSKHPLLDRVSKWNLYLKPLFSNHDNIPWRNILTKGAFSNGWKKFQTHSPKWWNKPRQNAKNINKKNKSKYFRTMLQVDWWTKSGYIHLWV